MGTEPQQATESKGRSWQMQDYARLKGVKIVGDMPIYVGAQSADVWAHQELFELDEAGNALNVAGVPPDAFSETGQLWGNPLYDWPVCYPWLYSNLYLSVLHALARLRLDSLLCVQT